MPSTKPSFPHWSASRFMLFEQCPVQYKERYVEGIATVPSLAMLFGHSVHTALECLLQGHRGGCPVTATPHEDHLTCARDAYWREFERMRSILADEGVEASGLLYLEGLRMIDQVAELGLNDDGASTSERWFKIPTNWPGPGGLFGPEPLPVVGAVDLWCPPWSKHGAVVFDFKTTVGHWSQERADRERWQPLLYAWAYLRAFGRVPVFRYLVLNRVDGSMSTFDRTWSSRREFDDDLSDLQFHAEEIAEAIAEGNFTCTRGHGTCLECGEPYGHHHVCREASRKAKIRLSHDRVESTPTRAW